jgi:uncharacterized membrane protein YvlD (DUF360 family)
VPPPAIDRDGKDKSRKKEKEPPRPAYTGPEPRILIRPRWAVPLIGMLFAILNVALYWILRPLLDLATLRTASFAIPFVVNGLLLWGTARIVHNKQWLKISGVFAALWLAMAVTIAQGVLWVALDYLPAKL